ncbi:MAG: DUF2341 domain-containing protein [Thermoplasmatales archaeon]|nr:MAG: DUF2341 domain-containing protein [Thermoplasmatales archaeon]
MLARAILLKTVLLIIIVLMPLAFSGLSFSKSITTKNANCNELTASSVNSVLVAGDFQYFNVTLTFKAKKICIIAYHSDEIPKLKDQSVSNYYKWEYNNGVWRDISGHDSVYIKNSLCVKDNYTYSFYLGIDRKANPGHWSVKVLVDDKEAASFNPSFMVVVGFNFFLSAIIGIFEPDLRDKKFLVNIDFIYSKRKRIIVESEKNIDILVDKALRKHAVSDGQEDLEEINESCFFEDTPPFKNESVKSTITTYPRSKLKNEQTNEAFTLIFNKKWGEGNSFSVTKIGNHRRFLAIILIIILFSAIFIPIINPQDTKSSSYPIISSFNVHPDKLKLGESLLLNVSVSDSVGIVSVFADIGGLETFNMSFVEGTIVNDTIYSGFWQSAWFVQNVNPGSYSVEITAFNKDNRSVTQQRVFTVLPIANDVNVSINDTLEPEFNESSNITQNEEQNNIVTQNTTNGTINNTTFPESNASNLNENFSTDITTDDITRVNQTSSQMEDENTVFIVDKRHEEVSVLPGTRFYVERTIDGPQGTNVIFVPMFSNSLTLESIEVVDNIVENLEWDMPFIISGSPHVFDVGKADSSKEKKIEQLREKLPPEIIALNKVAYTDHVELQSPRTIRLWFRAPSWEEMQKGMIPSSGEISYLIFSDDENGSFDFEGSTWWSSDWSYRKLITINSSQVEADLVNFPILVSVIDSDLASKAQDDGDDIAFVLDSDSTQLNHEIESFNGTTGELVVWVNVTSLSSSVDTLIWMYYNNSVCSSQENVTNTWDSNYVAVWHFHNNSLNDSTSSGYNGVNSGTSYNSSCKIAGGREYNGDEWININNFATLSTSLTAETWVYRDSSDTQNFIRFFTEGLDWNDNDWCLYWRIGASNLRFVINNNDYSTGGLFAFSGTWFHTAITYDSGDAYLYKNGGLEADWSGDYGASINNVYDTLTIGNQNNGGRDWIGRMDEVRISNIRRSTAWLGTTYNTTNSPDTFLSFAGEENVTDTSVDPISPYNITYSPLTITATAVTGLDNVTLWYRFSTDNSSWGSWVEDVIDIYSPWEWSFSFPNSIGYYEFYSIGKKSGFSDEIAPSNADAICFFNSSLNTPPTISLINPAPNGTTGVNQQPICRVWTNDSDGDTLTVYWYENTTGLWVLQQTNNNVTANSIINWTLIQASEYETTYWWKVAVNDSTDNTTVIYYFTTKTIETSVDTISPYIITSSPLVITTTGASDLDNVTLYYRWSDYNFTEWDILTYDDFEGATFNWGNYTDGGADCLEYTGGTHAHQGSNAADIQDNSGVASSFYHTSGIDVDTPEYKYIKVDFWFRGEEMEDGEDFWVGYYNGTSWTTVATYVSGTDFVNGQFYHETVWINESIYNYPSNMQIRFQCDASTDADDIYIDEIYVNATTTIGDSTEWAIWSDTTNPDDTYPWNWSFDFPDGIGYYEFYSIGNKSGSPNETHPAIADTKCYYNPNPAPTIELIYPDNGSTNISLQPICQIKANDGNGDPLTVYWYENTGGPWLLRQTNSSVPANSTVNWPYIQADGNGITYWWKVAVNDSVSNTTAIFYFTTKPMNTSVNPISPYIVTYSPYNISATGSSDLDNVTLYYRWSDNNFTWTTLTYDDFEGAAFEWGNYTDGGADCLEYTGGTYAHQGNNAADIQDDNSVASSFYYSFGSDVDSPGYKYIRVDFWFRGEEMEGGEDFWVRYFDGSDWNDVTTYVAGVDFINGQFYHEIVWINETDLNFPNNMNIRFQCDASTDADDIYIDEIYVNATTTLGNYTGWKAWNDNSNPDDTYPWNWSFNFPDGTGYYEFYSIGKKSGSTDESAPTTADAKCYYYLGLNPIINSYDLLNNTGSKLNNATGLLDVNSEYYISINVTEPNGWDEIYYINITAWYDNGSDAAIYNQTQGGNLNMLLQYENTTGTANFRMLWPDEEAQLIPANCTETIIDSTTRLINFSFKSLSQVRWASSNNTWNSTEDVYNDKYSWNFNITVVDATNRKDWKINEYGVYKFTSISSSQDWVDIIAAPGFNDTSSVVTIMYSSNYNFNMTLYFEENLTNITWNDFIPITNNVYILEGADPNDDIIQNMIFKGINEENSVDIFNISGIFHNNNITQIVNVQFEVYIPFGTKGGRYTARVATKIIQK